MIRKTQPKQDVQKKSYHTDRFYQPLQTQKTPLEETEFKDIYHTLSQEVAILQSYLELKQAVFYVKKDDVRQTLMILKTLNYNVMSEMSAIDNLLQENCFEIFYQLTSHEKSHANRRRLRVKCAIMKDESMPSVSDIYPCANWSERECYDMFGIKFDNHPFLKRILMPIDWIGHPLLKTYPLKGDEFAAWYEIDKIFGKEYREVIGPEQRDSARVDRNDSINFAQIGKEVSKGVQPQDSIHAITYQESQKPPIVKRFPNTKPTLKEKRV